MAQLMPLPLTISCSSKSILVLPYWFLPHDALQCKAQSCYRMSSIRLSLTLVDHDHIGWKSCKLTAWTITQHLRSL